MALLLILTLFSHPLNAQQGKRPVFLADALRQLPDGGDRFLKKLGNRKPEQAAALVRIESSTDLKKLSLISVTPTLAIHYGDVSTWPHLRTQPGVRSVAFASPRALLMDEAAQTIGLSAAHLDAGLRGEGTLVGVVDTGIDFDLPAFKTSSGETRVHWYLAFDQAPAGLHPALEEEYGCTGAEPCAIYSRDDINAMIASSTTAQLGMDRIGHGSHVTSLAAGGDGDYPGVAPLSGLIIVSSSSNGFSVSDPLILLGTKFIFDRAKDLNQPVAVNISLGSSFGAHDGSSLLEQGLSELGAGKGRAVIVAAGNEGTLLTDLSEAYPGPFGITTEVALLSNSDVRVPFLTAPTSDGTTTGGVFLWIALDQGSEASLGFHNGRGSETARILPGEIAGFNSKDLDDDDDYDIVILNGKSGDFEPEVPPGSIVFGLTGTFTSGRVFEVILHGRGTARLWSSGTGEASSGFDGLGPVFPRARTQGTVAVPGSAPHLITVGATLNRTEWTDYTGATNVFSTAVVDTWSDFSSSGPNLLGNMKPELVAPGGGVTGAMASAADPRTSLGGSSVFSSHGRCPDSTECFVVDDVHALASGTSLSAPIVTGAIALLMQRQPELTMREAKAFLMAGAALVDDQTLGSTVGVGRLDLTATLMAQERALSGESGTADPTRSRVTFADNYVRAPSGPSLFGAVSLRDEAGLPTGDDKTKVTVEIMGPGFSEVRYAAPGLYEFTVTPEKGSAGQSLTVTAKVDGHIIDSTQIPIERDATLAAQGYSLLGGTCRVAPASVRGGGPGFLFLLLFMASARRRRAKAH